MTASNTNVWRVLIVALLLLAAGGLWLNRGAITSELLESMGRGAPLPTPVSPGEVARQVAATPTAKTVTPKFAPDSANLAIPFSPQAPFADWEQPYQDACEEAAILMAERSLRGQTLSPEEAQAEILRMVDFQNEHYGFYKDSNISESVRLVEEYFPDLTARAIYDVTPEIIRAEVAAGRPIVALVDGRLLGNPFYTAPGPDKHALVIKGFTHDAFITHDPGTKRGADFVYAEGVLMDALVDYDGGAPGTGKKAIIVLTLAS